MLRSSLFLCVLAATPLLCCFSSGSLQVKAFIRDHEGEALGLDSSGYAKESWVNSVFSRVVGAMTQQINQNLVATQDNTTKLWIVVACAVVIIILSTFKVYMSRHYRNKRDKLALEVRRVPGNNQDQENERNNNNNNAV